MRLGMREGYQLYVRAIGQDLFHAQFRSDRISEVQLVGQIDGRSYDE